MSGEIRGYQDPGSIRGDWIFDKESLDEYRTAPIANIHQKALSILKSM